MKFRKIISMSIICVILSCIFLNLINSKSYAVSQTISTQIDKIDEKKYPGVKKLIKALQTSHPNWKFKVLYTNLSWNTVIANEYIGHGKSPRNLVPANSSSYSGDWVCCVCGSRKYDSGSWVCASESAIKYMMDPRNSLNESDIFQFQELTYDGYNKDTIKKMVKGTFLNNDDCINAIKDVSKTSNVSPYYIVARILQEQGKTGSVLTKGQGYDNQYEGYYNVFNIGATGGSKSKVILNGLKKAKEKGWTTLALSIKGGVEFIAKDYIARGQNTLYFQKFDVDSSDNSLYYHQYMQNILAAQKEGETLKKTYEDVNSIDGEYTFIIPLYENMPEVACIRPSTTTATSVSTDIVKVNVNSKIKLRASANGTATNEYLYKDEIVTRLEKATKKVNGTYWDKVMKSNGVIGYVARETDEGEEYKLYLEPIVIQNNGNSNPITPEQPNNSTNVVSNKKVKLDKTTSIVTIVPGTKVSDIVNLIGKNTFVKDANGKEVESSKIPGTGYRVNDTYTISMIGDLNGDGLVKSSDYMLIKKYIMESSKLKVSQKEAADVDKDGNIRATDYMKIKNYIMGKTTIEIK